MRKFFAVTLAAFGNVAFGDIAFISFAAYILFKQQCRINDITLSTLYRTRDVPIHAEFKYPGSGEYFERQPSFSGVSVERWRDSLPQSRQPSADSRSGFVGV